MRNIVVTGGNRGLGEATASHFLQVGEDVCVTVRSSLGQEMVQAWHTRLEQSNPRLGRLTVAQWDAEAPERISSELEYALEHCDVLVNNAGWEADLGIAHPDGYDHNILLEPSDIFMKAIQINSNAPRVLMGRVIEGMKNRDYGRIVNVSSGLARISPKVEGPNCPSYRLSKALLALIAKEAAFECPHPNIKINAMAPGWCKTRMGGPNAPDDVLVGAQRIVDLCNLPADGVSGTFWMDGVLSSLL